jgi:hypothetical protein
MTRADRVPEPRVLGAREGERGDAELPDPAQALNLRRVDERRDDGVLGPVERDDPVDWISKDQI